MIIFIHYICVIEQILAWKQITTRKREHRKELVVLEKGKFLEKTKKELPKYQRSMKGPRRKPLTMYGPPSIVLSKVRRHYTLNLC
jgi:hypothetical protein